MSRRGNEDNQGLAAFRLALEGNKFEDDPRCDFDQGAIANEISRNQIESGWCQLAGIQDACCK